MSNTGNNFKIFAGVLMAVGILLGVLLGAMIPVVEIELSDSIFSDSIWEESEEMFNTALCFIVMAGFEVLAFLSYIAGKHFEKQDIIIDKLSSLVSQAPFKESSSKTPPVPKTSSVPKTPPKVTTPKVTTPAESSSPSAIPDDPDDRNIYSSSNARYTYHVKN